MKKIYTGEIKKLSIKKLEPKPDALINIAYESTVFKKDALFYVNFMGVVISLDYGTKLLRREEAEYYLKSGLKVNPSLAHLVPCLYQDSEVKFSHEITDEEFKQIKKTARVERRAARKSK